MALIALEGMHFFANHGYYEEERLSGGEFIVDIWVEAPVDEAAMGDDLYQTINYEKLYVFCHAEMKKPSKLLERVAYGILSRVLDHFGELQGIRIRIRKKNPPMGGRIESASVELGIGTLQNTNQLLLALLQK